MIWKKNLLETLKYMYRSTKTYHKTRTLNTFTFGYKINLPSTSILLYHDSYIHTSVTVSGFASFVFYD